jgi:hypothetical protein
MNHHDPYVQAAIDGEIGSLASAADGTRNDSLFRSTAKLASLGIQEGEILRRLKPVAEQIGLRGSEFYMTVKSGVKIGSARPRQIPNRNGGRMFLRAGSPPSTTSVTNFVAGVEGPPVWGDELRRHLYRRNGLPVRVKIKRASGGYVNWYSVLRDGRMGWQPAKPDDYLACPYIGVVDPFDPALPDRTIYWPEGEKDCDTLGLAGLPAFTFGGTGDGLPDGILEFLRDRHVVIFADNDVGGQTHSSRKAALAYPVARSVKIVEFPELPPKQDVSDFLQHASSADLETRISQAPFWAPAVAKPEVGWRASVITASALKTKTFNPVQVVVPGYISEGVTIFAGKPKIGKSWLLYDVCLACTADRFVLGQIKPSQGDVLYLALEDSHRRLKKRLEKLRPDGAWPSRLTLATDWKKSDGGGLEELAEWCESVNKPVLIVIDTLEKFRPAARSNAAAYSTDYLAITGLHKLAHARGIAIVVIHHVRKMDAEDPFDMVSGTNGLTGAADTILVLRRQAGTVTLHARGRDIEEKETACRFDKTTCRWTLLGDAVEVHGSGERAAITAALGNAGSDGMHISEIMAATERSNRNAADQLLFKMQRDGDLVRVKRGVYALPDKIGKKERSDGDVAEK